MIVDLTQEEIDLIKMLLDYLVDYLGYSQTEAESILIDSIKSKLDGA